MSNWVKHLKTINHHKWLVLKYCFRAGLYKQGLLHDLSKYSWVEFSVGAKYFQGTEARIMRNGKQMAIVLPGCITKGEINIIWSTGSITV